MAAAEEPSAAERYEELLRALEAKIETLTKENETLKAKAYRDPLTGLANREGLAEQERRRFDSQKPFSVLMLDIDNFKSINDTYGHDAGDAVLKKTAEHLAETTRKKDIVSRWGGEEFVVVFNNAEPQDIVNKFFNKKDKRPEIVLEVDVGETKIPITLSGGVTALAQHEDLQAALARADEALYASKENGKNRITNYGALEKKAALAE